VYSPNNPTYLDFRSAEVIKKGMDTETLQRVVSGASNTASTRTEIRSCLQVYGYKSTVSKSEQIQDHEVLEEIKSSKVEPFLTTE